MSSSGSDARYVPLDDELFKKDTENVLIIDSPIPSSKAGLQTSSSSLKASGDLWASTSTVEIEEELAPIEQANLFSKILFIFLEKIKFDEPLLKLGNERPLVYADLPPLAKIDAAAVNTERLEDAWDKCRPKGPYLLLFYCNFFMTHWRLFQAIGIAFGYDYALAGIPALIATLCLFSQPIVASEIIKFATVHNHSVWYGLGLVLFAFLLQVTAGICEQNYFFYQERVGMHVSNALSSLVYRKSLRLPSISSGNASNLLTVDPRVIATMVWNVHSMWRFPVRILIAMIALYHWLGWTSLVGLAVMAVLGPLNAIVLRRMLAYDKKIMKLRDERVKKLSEVLHGVQLIKLFAWEPQMSARVISVRADEVANIKGYAYWTSVLNFLAQLFATLVATAVLSAYAAVHHSIAAETVFPSLVLLENLTWPVLWFPQLLSRTVEAFVSMRRLNEFLRREELTQLERIELRDHCDDFAVVATNARFQHFPPDKELDPEKEAEKEAETEALEAASNPKKSANEKKKKKEKNGQTKGQLKKHGETPLDSSKLNDEDSLQALEMDAESTQLVEREHASSSSLSSSAAADIASSKSKSKSKSRRDFVLIVNSFKVRRGELVGVIGRVGAGKSSLLSALLGELRTLQGEVMTKGSVGLVSQQAWIRNTTLRENILFGRVYEEERYQSVLNSCALVEDLKLLPGGDLTEIGEKGVNLSGGQKQRVSLARAAYADLDVYLFDDPLSAVDAHVGKHLFDECITQLLRGKTRVLVTHQLQFVSRVDRLYVLDKGALQQEGTFREIMHRGVDFAALLQGAHQDHEDEVLSQSTPSITLKSTGESTGKDDSTSTSTNGDGSASAAKKASKKKQSDKSRTKVGKFTQDEEHVTGSVHWSVYSQYLLGAGAVVLVILFIISLILEVSKVSQRKWLSVWSDGYFKPDPGLKFYLMIYLGLALLQTVSVFIRQFLWVKSALDSAKSLHDRFLEAILRAPMSFFHTTPVGRIVNRFSKDQQSVDQQLPEIFSDFFLTIFGAVSIMILISITTPWFIIAAIPIILVYYYVQSFYRPSSRELGRLNSIMSSPIFAQYSETLHGLAVIRAYRAEHILRRESENLMDRNARAYFQVFAAVRWLGMRVEAVGALVALTVGLIAVFSNGLSAGAVGLTLSLAASVTGNLNAFIRSAAQLETNINNVERILHMIDVKPEAPRIIEECRPPRGWPNEGKVEFHDVHLRYREDLEPVLKGISLTISPMEKIGVVGRTGAGKSSLTNALFRIVEPFQGKLMIDGEDISRFGLHDVRSNLSIIPQEPVLFSGTVRSNLDPFETFSDQALWSVLDRVHMKEYIKALPLRLDAQITENGGNLSVGQRQLLCIGRALIRDPKILVMDEATASVDNETDALVQRTVRSEFKDKTVITIAHRLNTIMDSDRVLVMDKGFVKEFDTPMVLLQNPDGLFTKLVENTGKNSSEKLKTMARNASSGNLLQGISSPVIASEPTLRGRF